MEYPRPDVYEFKNEEYVPVKEFYSKPHQGTLVNWSYIYVGKELSVIGYMKDSPRYDQSTSEYQDNHRVITSMIMSCDGENLETRNSRYTLESPMVSTLSQEDIEKHYNQSSTIKELFILKDESLPILYPVRE